MRDFEDGIFTMAPAVKLDTLSDNNDIGKPWRYEDGEYTVTRTSPWSPPGCHPVGCGLKLYVDKDGRLQKVEGDENNPVTQGRLCPRCVALKDYIYSPARLLHPMLRDRADRGKADAWKEVSWDEAYDLIVEKVSYYFRAPERFDVIVFELKNEKGVHFIKRIVGLPGETVQIRDGAVYIDGKRLENDVYGLAEIQNAYLAGEPVELGENEDFVLGDNRNNSKDSRIIGPVERKQFLGRAFFRFFPFNKMGLIRHD